MENKPGDKPKVLFLPRWYPNRFDPMPGLFIRRHALSVSRDFDIAILYVHLNFDYSARRIETSISDYEGMKEIKIYTKASKTGLEVLDSLINLFYFFLAHYRGFKLVREEFGMPDLVHVNVLTRCGFIAYLLRIRYRIPYVITEHWTRYLPGMSNFKGFLRKWLSRIVVRQASAVMPVTMNLQKAMEMHGLSNTRYIVIPNVVDTGKFSPIAETRNIQDRMFLHVSCFDDAQKNISGILRVLNHLKSRRTDWRCVMVGDGIHYQKLVRLAEELNLKDRFVFFTGLKEGDDLVHLMQHANFQFMFSRYENLPVVIPESFACGVPFISTDVGGIAEHLKEDMGILIPSGDESALLDAIEFMLDHPEKYRKDTIRRYALDHFSQEVIGKQIELVYKEALQNSGK